MPSTGWSQDGDPAHTEYSFIIAPLSDDVRYSGFIIMGMPVDKAEAFRADDLLELLGIEISPARLKCAMLSLETLEHALAEKPDSATDAEAPAETNGAAS